MRSGVTKPPLVTFSATVPPCSAAAAAAAATLGLCMLNRRGVLQLTAALPFTPSWMDMSG